MQIQGSHKIVACVFKFKLKRMTDLRGHLEWLIQMCLAIVIVIIFGEVSSLSKILMIYANSSKWTCMMATAME